MARTSAGVMSAARMVVSASAKPSEVRMVFVFIDGVFVVSLLSRRPARFTIRTDGLLRRGTLYPDCGALRRGISEVPSVFSIFSPVAILQYLSFLPAIFRGLLQVLRRHLR